MKSSNHNIKVLYDSQIFEVQKYGGISRYFYETAKCLKNTDVDFSIVFSKNHYIKDKDITNHISFLSERLFKIMRGSLRKVNNFNTVRKLKDDYDIFHPTYYNPYFLRHLDGKKFVLTVHDMIHEKFPEFIGENDTTAANKALLVANAARIIAISENTKKDLIDILNVNPDKIDVIYHGIKPLNSGYNKLNLPQNYILYVGERGGYKNFARLVEAFQQVLVANPGIKLICTGRPFKSAEIASFKKKGIEHDVIHIDADDKKLEQLYRQASVMVYPSLYEGFGIPILESFAYDCPLALSNTSCFPEIAGNAGEYFDPYSIGDMIRAINLIINDADRRSTLIDLGRERVKRYTWNETARLTEQTYLKALGLSSF